MLLVINMRSIQKLDMRIMGYITMFEKLTKTESLDFLENKGQLVFFVKENSAKKAAGKQGSNIKRLSHLLKKKVKIIELNEDPKKFVQSLIFPLEPSSIELKEGKLVLSFKTSEERARIIGRNGSNLEFLNKLLENHHKLSLKVVS